MILKDEMARSGRTLFRWRSYVPLFVLLVVAYGLANFHYLGDSEVLDVVWELVCLTVAACGLGFRALTVGFAPAHTSGRNTKRQEAASLNATGMYSIVRHPLYLGNFLIWLGITLFPHDPWVVLVAVLAFWVYYERIMLAEEDFLESRFGAAFSEWAERTPAFLPAFRNWVPPGLPFSWRATLARENSTWFATIATFFALELAGDFFAGRDPSVDLGWLLLFSAGLTAYIVLRWMKKHHRLDVDGR
jgi:protein-S-isoprenylcysteine O-methyltransferase Ste14